MMALISTLKPSDLIAIGLGKYIFGMTEMSDYKKVATLLLTIAIPVENESSMFITL